MSAAPPRSPSRELAAQSGDVRPIDDAQAAVRRIVTSHLRACGHVDIAEPVLVSLAAGIARECRLAIANAVFAGFQRGVDRSTAASFHDEPTRPLPGAVRSKQ